MCSGTYILGSRLKKYLRDPAKALSISVERPIAERGYQWGSPNILSLDKWRIKKQDVLLMEKIVNPKKDHTKHLIYGFHSSHSLKNQCNRQRNTISVFDSPRQLFKYQIIIISVCICMLSPMTLHQFLIRCLSHYRALTTTLWFINLSKLIFFCGELLVAKWVNSNIHILFKINKCTAPGSWCNVLISVSLSIPAPGKHENTYVYFPSLLEQSL